MIPVVLLWLMALNAFVIIQFYIPNEILHLHADAVGLLSAYKAGSFRPKGKTEQGVNFLTSWSRVDVPGREEQQPHSGSHSPSGSCEICRCFEHVHKPQLSVVKHYIINHDNSFSRFLSFS